MYRDLNKTLRWLSLVSSRALAQLILTHTWNTVYGIHTNLNLECIDCNEGHYIHCVFTIVMDGRVPNKPAMVIKCVYIKLRIYLLVLLWMSVNLEQLSTCLHTNVMLVGCYVWDLIETSMWAFLSEQLKHFVHKNLLLYVALKVSSVYIYALCLLLMKTCHIFLTF